LWNVAKHDTVRTDHSSVANLDRSRHDGIGADADPVADYGCTRVPSIDADCDAVCYAAAPANDSSAADDDSIGVTDVETGANLGLGADTDASRCFDNQTPSEQNWLKD